MTSTRDGGFVLGALAKAVPGVPTVATMRTLPPRARRCRQSRIIQATATPLLLATMAGSSLFLLRYAIVPMTHVLNRCCSSLFQNDSVLASGDRHQPAILGVFSALVSRLTYNRQPAFSHGRHLSASNPKTPFHC